MESGVLHTGPNSPRSARLARGLETATATAHSYSNHSVPPRAPVNGGILENGRYQSHKDYHKDYHNLKVFSQNYFALIC